MTLGLISIIVSWRVLSRPGVSRELRKLVFRRHFAYITAYAFCNLFPALSDFAFSFKGRDFEIEHNWIIFSISILFYSQGIIMALLRLFEPVFYVIGLRNTKVWVLGLCKRNVEDEVHNWSLMIEKWQTAETEAESPRSNQGEAEDGSAPEFKRTKTALMKMPTVDSSKAAEI